MKTKIQWTDENTRYYGPDAGVEGEILESEFLRINEKVVVDEEEKEGGEEGDKDAKMGASDKDKDPSSQDETKQAENKSEKAPPAVAAVPDSENKLVEDNLTSKAQAQAQTPPDNFKNSTTRHTPIFIGEYSTLIGARKLHLGLVANSDPFTNKKIGVLNFASAKQAGGGFRNGSQAQVRHCFSYIYITQLVNQEESLARTSTLFPSLISDAPSEFYTHYREDASNAYYTHAMVYSPGIVIFRDDNGEWRTPVEVDILTSAAVNAGEIRRRLEKEERLRRERLEDDIWRRLGEERRKANEKAAAERQKLREEKAKEKKKAELMKLQKKSRDKNEKTETDKGKEINKSKGKATGKGKEREETSVEQEKEDAEQEKEKVEKVEEEQGVEEEEEEEEQVEKAQEGEKVKKERGDDQIEKEKGEEAAAEKSKENQEEKETDGPECTSADGMKNAEESTEAKGTSIQNNQPQPAASLEVNQEFTSSSTISHPLSSQAQPSQATDPDPGLTYALARAAAESQIENIMYDRISRILHLFQLQQVPYLILGSFGTGVFQNRTEVVATIFADLLIKPDGRFKNVFETVVFAILGKETLKTFWDVFARADKRAKREMGKAGRPCVLLDADEWNGWDGDLEEGEDEKAIRMMRWEARRTEIMEAAQAEADLACFVDTQPDWAADTFPLEVDTLSFAVAQAEVDAAPFISHADTGVASAEVNLTATDDDEIAEDERMILTEDDEKVDLVSEETTTPKAMVVDDSKDVEMVEVRSLPASHCESQNGKLNEEEDGDIEMQS